MTQRSPFLRRNAIATAALMALSGGPVQAADVSWIGPNASFWDLVTNWNPALPGAADDALLGAFDTTFRSGALTIRSFSGTGLFSVTGGTLTFTNASSVGSFAMTSGQLSGTGNLTITGAATLTAAAFSGAGTTTVQGITTISGTGLSLDGGRIFRNEGTLTQTNASVDLNSRRSGSAEGGNGTVTNAAGGIWNSNTTASGSNFIFASNQGAGDTGAGALFTNQGTFNKLGAAITGVRTAFNNTGSINVQAGQLQFDAGGALTHNGTISVASGAILDFASNGTVTQTINTASTTIAGTLQISGDNFVNFTQAHTIGGTGTFLQNAGQVTGANLTLGPTLAFNITDGGHSGNATTTVQGTSTISGTGLRLDGGRIFRNEGTLTQTNANVDLNSRRSGSAEAGNGTVTNAAAGIWNSNATVSASNFIFASNQGGADTGAGALFTNQGTFNKLGTAITEVRTAFNNTGSINVQAGQLQFGTGGALTHNGTISVASGAILDFASNGTVAQTINTASTTIAGTLQISGDNFVNFTQAHTIGGTGTFLQNAGQVTGANLTLGPTLAFNITDGGHSGNATTTVQGTSTISGTGLRLDGGRTFRNEGTLTQTNANVDLNSRRSGSAEAGNGTVTNAAAGIWNSNATVSASNFIFASNQGGADTGAGALFTNQGTFNKLGTAITEVRTAFNNTGSINVQAGQLQFGTGGALTHNGTISVASGAILDFASNGTVTQTINTASTTIAGTLQISGDNFVNFTQAHTIGGTGTFLQNFGQVTGANLTLGPTLAFNITDGGHSGNATTTVQGTGTISGTGLRLDGGRTFRNEGTLTQTNANVDLNSRRAGSAEAGNGTVTNAAAGIWNSNATVSASNFIFASNLGGADTGAGALFTNQGTFNKLGTAITEVRTAFNNTGAINVQAGQLQFGTGGALTHNGTISVASGAVLDFASSGLVTQTINTASTTIAGTLQISNDNFVNFTQAHTIGGTGTFLQNFGQVTGANLTLGPTLAFNITDGGHSGNATTTVQGTSTISGTGLRLDGGRIFRNEGTLTQTNANVDLNSRRSGIAEAGNGTVTNAAAGIWNSNATVSASNFILASNLGGADTGAGALFTNQGTFNKQGAFITEVRTAFNNTGLTDVQAGLLRFTTNGTQGTGTLRTSGGNLEIQGASTTGNLFHNTNTANSLILGANTITVGSDYDNANFGVGNAFNRRANVSTTGTGARLLAGGDANQGLSGAGISNGNTTTPTITIGNVHVGATTYTYNINNTGTTGPALRGAIQNAVNGGNISDTRLSGNGVLSSNWGPVAPGGSVSRDITITVGAAGLFAPINGQAVSIVNNFENTRSQLLTITSAAGAAAYNLAAAAAVTPNPVNLGNQRVGGTGSAALTVTNIAPAGSFSEGLNAVFAGTSGSALTNGGAISLLAAGASNNTAMTVRLDGSTAGAKTGGVQVNFASDGSGTSGLGITGLAGQVINVSGNFYNAAIGSATPSPITIANQRVNGTGSQVLSVANTAAAGAFSEALNASFTATSFGITSNGGSVTNLIAGGTNAAAMSVGVNTATAGAKSGSVTLAYQSDGTGSNGNSGLAAISAGSQTINVSGNVYNAAVGAATPTPVLIANQRIGGNGSQMLTVSNTAAAGAFSEALNASFGANTGTATNNGGSVGNLIAGGSNAALMSVGVNTGTSGAKSGTVTLNYQTDGTGPNGNSGLAAIGAGSQVINVSGNVYQSAVGQLNTAALNFGTVQVGQSVSQVLSITNSATGAAGFVEDLNARFGASSGTGSNLISGSGSISNLLAGTTNSGAMTVNVNTAAAGSVNGAIAVNYFSAGAVNSVSNGLGELAVGSSSYGVAGIIEAVANVINQASPLINNTVINLGNVRVGAISPTQAVSITNVATVAPQAALNATVSAAAPITASGSFNLLAPGATNNSSIVVGMQTGTAGAKNGTATVSFVSDASNVGNCAPNCQLGIGTQNVSVSGNVFNAAVGSATPTPVTLANQRVGGTVSQLLTVSNTAAAGAFSEDLNASVSGFTGAAGSTGGNINSLLAGSSSQAIGVRVDTGTSGAKNGTVTLAYQTAGTVNGVSNGLGTAGAGSQVIGVSGNVYQSAAGQLNTAALNFGTVQVGQSVSQVLSITNSATGAAGFVEDLNARFGASSGTGSNLISGNGSITNLLAGTTNSSTMTVNVNTTGAGTVNGAIAVNYFSAGAVNSVSNGLGELGVGSSSYGVAGIIQAVANVINQASPLINNTVINLGNVRVGAASPTQAVSISNVATVAPQAALNATVSAAAPITASGSFNLLAPGATNNSSIVVGMQTGTAGAKNGTATVSFVSDASNVGNCAPNCQLGIGMQNVSVSGNVYRLANPTLNTPSIDLVARVGDTNPSMAVGVTNISPDAFTERLNGSFGGVAPGFVGSGAIIGLNAGASSSALALSMNTASAGTFAGVASVNFISSGAGTTGAPDAALASQQVALSGRVYTPAIGQVNTTEVDFGIVHKGDVVSARNVSVSNAAAIAAPNDVLRGSLGGAVGAFSAGGSLAGVAAQATDNSSLSVALDTSSAGIYSGTANATFVSHNGELADLALTGGTVVLKAQVNNYAELGLGKVGGDGVLASAASLYTYDFGTIVLGSTGRAAELAVSNVAIGPADLLNGAFGFGPGTGFSFAGFNPFADIAAGSSFGGLNIFFGSTSLGTFSQTITISSFGANASGYKGSVFDTLLVLRGTVTDVAAVPEPGTFALMIGGLLAIWAARRRQQRRPAA